MVEQLHPPPKPSLPREAPWREIEAIVDGLRLVANKLDNLYSAYTGVAPPVEVVVTPPEVVIPPTEVVVPPPTVIIPPVEVVVPPPTVIIPMPDIPPPVIIPPAPVELAPVTDRLDDLRQRLDVLISLFAWANAPVAPTIIPGPPELAPIISRLDALITGLVGNLPTFQTGQKDVTTAGKPEQLDDFPIPTGFKLTVIARPGNTGYIYLGKNKGDCANNKRRFDGLGAGLAHSLRVKNASAVWVDASVDGEGVSWSVEASR